MVHGLDTLNRMNREASKKQQKTVKARLPADVPEDAKLNPFLVRNLANRPWTAKELGREPDFYKAYAESDKEPFGGKASLKEGPRS